MGQKCPTFYQSKSIGGATPPALRYYEKDRQKRVEAEAKRPDIFYCVCDNVGVIGKPCDSVLHFVFCNGGGQVLFDSDELGGVDRSTVADTRCAYLHCCGRERSRR